MSERTCSVEGCGRPRASKGFCDAHYRRATKTGDPGGPIASRRKRPRLRCLVRECDRAHFGHGMCSRHYQLWRHHGTTDLLDLATPIERFWREVTRGEPNECWLWMGTPKNGYGVLSIKTREDAWAPHYAHRLSYEWFVGPIPEGMVIDHTCHNVAAERGLCDGGEGCSHRLCVNPLHLDPTTVGENTARSPLTVTGQNVRKNVCPRGHALDGKGLDGKRYCTLCRKTRDSERRRRSSQIA